MPKLLCTKSQDHILDSRHTNNKSQGISIKTISSWHLFHVFLNWMKGVYKLFGKATRADCRPIAKILAHGYKACATEQEFGNGWFLMMSKL